MTTFDDLNSLITRLGGGFFGADSDRVGGKLDLTAFAHDLVGFAGSGWGDGGLCGGDGGDAKPAFLINSLKSLIDSRKASIMSKTAGWTAIWPSGRTFDAHLRQAASIFSSGDVDGLGGSGGGGVMNAIIV